MPKYEVTWPARHVGQYVESGDWSDYWRTAISEVREGRILVRGYPIEEIIEKLTATEAYWLLLKGALLYLATDYLQAQRVRARIRHSLREVFRRVDVLVSPTAPLPATPIGRLEVSLKSRTVSVLDVGARLTCVANLTGEPACSVPCGFTRAGLPVGLMVHGRVFADAKVLRVAHAYEQACGWTAHFPGGL